MSTVNSGLGQVAFRQAQPVLEAISKDAPVDITTPALRAAEALFCADGPFTPADAAVFAEWMKGKTLDADGEAIRAANQARLEGVPPHKSGDAVELTGQVYAEPSAGMAQGGCFLRLDEPIQVNGTLVQRVKLHDDSWAYDAGPLTVKGTLQVVENVMLGTTTVELQDLPPPPNKGAELNDLWNWYD